jgi:hypothetical protein
MGFRPGTSHGALGATMGDEALHGGRMRASERKSIDGRAVYDSAVHSETG